MRPCNVGPVPACDEKLLHDKLKKHALFASDPWEFKAYNELKMTQKADVSSLISLAPLISCLLDVQPACRFLPSVLGDVLARLFVEHAHLNTSRTETMPGVPHRMFAAAVARRIACMCYHFRRVARDPEEWSHLPDDDYTTFSGLVQHHLLGAPTAPRTPPRRTLKPQISATSASSDDGPSFAVAMGLAPTPIDDLCFASAMGLDDSTLALDASSSHASASKKTEDLRRPDRG